MIGEGGGGKQREKENRGNFCPGSVSSFMSIYLRKRKSAGSSNRSALPQAQVNQATATGLVSVQAGLVLSPNCCQNDAAGLELHSFASVAEVPVSISLVNPQF